MPVVSVTSRASSRETGHLAEDLGDILEQLQEVGEVVLGLVKFLASNSWIWIGSMAVCNRSVCFECNWEVDDSPFVLTANV